MKYGFHCMQIMQTLKLGTFHTVMAIQGKLMSEKRREVNMSLTITADEHIPNAKTFLKLNLLKTK